MERIAFRTASVLHTDSCLVCCGNKIVFQNDLMGSLKFKRVKTSCGLASYSDISLTLLVLAELLRPGDITTRNSGASAKQTNWAQYC